MTSRRSPRRNPQIHFREEGAGVSRCCSPRLQPQVEATEEGAVVYRCCSPRPDLQIPSRDEGAGVARCCSLRLHPHIQAKEDGAGVTRRRRGTSPGAAASLPEDDDMLREILLRLPLRPSSLHRASAVCKRWRCIVGDPKFHRQFYARHRKPPLLGVFRYSNQGIVFGPILDPPDRVPPERINLGLDRHGLYDVLDCRHGRVLIKDLVRSHVGVCDPITGEQHWVAVPSEFRKRDHLEGAVLCAAGDHGHVHGGCHLSSYKVVLVSTGTSDIPCLGCVYSLETGVWGDLISLEAPFELVYSAHVRATLFGNCLYWTRGDRILEFDLDEQNLAAIMGPPLLTDIIYGNRQIIQAVDGALGYTILSYPCLEMWQRNINGHGVATWVQWKTIEMHTILRLPSPDEGIWVQLLGYDEDDDVVFLCYKGSVYIVQLKSMQSRKLDEIYSAGNCCFPFRNFFTPGTAIPGGFNGAEMLHTG